ncbi:D-alanyl-D-alanine carboxypeptidase family protein [Saccharopolyspora sp. 5N708]|uniref:D-alanyl-D-alanine carboxypeptidase family protein n=1 Tax=Saccharopolyspora sp. 5N708 TaxID=3457424 RepID=UPI003FD52AD4
MTDLQAFPTRERVFEAITKVLAVVLLPAAFLRTPGRARHIACQWALAIRFPAENLDGLTREARTMFTTARSEAFWRDGQLIGLTSGHRDAAEQHRLFEAEVRRTGSPHAARKRVLPPAESAHVKGIAMDVRPREGARWLETNGGRYQLYRTYDNEWWHFEHRHRAPRRQPNPGCREPGVSTAARTGWGIR